MIYRLDNRKFRKALAERGYATVSHFADAAGVHRNTISAYLSGTQSLFTNAMEKILARLNVGPLDLILPTLPGDASRVSNVEEILPVAENLAKANENVAVLLIGSRARTASRVYSDWDLGLTCGETPLDARTYLRLKTRGGDLCENLVRGVDIINLDAAPPWFLRGVAARPVYLAGSREAAAYFFGVWNAYQRQGQET